MLVLNNGDKLRGGASVAGVIDFTIHGLVGEDLNRFADGQLSDSLADLYVATATVVVTSFVLVNTDNVSRTINLYLQPDGGTSRRIVTKDLSLGVGHSLHYDGVNVNILGPSSGLNISTLVELTDTPNIYDADKYLRSTVSGTEWATVSGGAGTSDHSELSNLDYASSGHTGFSSGNDLTTLSGVLQTNIDGKSDTSHVHDDRYYTESEIDNIVDAKPDTLLELSDTPVAYDNNKYLKSTTSGFVLATVSGGDGTSDHYELSNLAYAVSGHTGFSPTSHSHTESDISDLDKYTQAEVDTISGTLQTEIDSTPTTLLDLADTPTTYSGSVGSYLRTTASGIDFFEQFSTDRAVYVAKNGSDDTENGSVANPFLTLQAAIDFAYDTWGPITDKANTAVIKVAPGIYEEQIHSYDGIMIVSYASGYDPKAGQPPVTLYNTGSDLAHYPLRSDEDEVFIMVGINIKTDSGGIAGKIPKGNFHNCRFTECYFIERNSWCYVYFSRCSFSGDYGGFYFVGTNLTSARNVILDNDCFIDGNKTPTLHSTHTSFANFKCTNLVLKGSISIKGNWEWRSTRCYVYNYDARNIFETTGGVYIVDSILVNGLHFVSNPLEFYLINSSFEGVADNRIPAGEADITADVTITNAKIKNTTTHNGLDGEIQIVNPTKIVGYGLTDGYRNITEALKSSSSGEVVQVYSGTYNENLIIPAGVDLIGSSKEHTTITSSSGTAITKITNTVSHIKNFTFISTASGTNNVHVVTSTAGSIEFIDCTLKVDLTDMYTEAVVMTNSNLVLNNTDLIYEQTGTTTGSGILHRCAYFDGDSSLTWKFGSLTSMIINDGNDLASASLCETTPTSNVAIVMNGSEATFLSQYPSWGGNAYAMKVDGTISGSVDCSELIVTIEGSNGAGDGYIFYVDTTNDSGTIYGSLNVLTATGFAKNYIGYVGTGNTFNSHFDMLNAVDSMWGTGTINFVTSPAPGNLQMSGYLFNPYSNIIEVAKTGAQFTSVKEAIDSITDSGVFNRYTVTVGPGIFTEDNPIQLKPWISVKSIATKEITMVSPQNLNSDLFIGCNRSYLSSMVLSGVSSGSALSFAETGFMTIENIIIVDCEHGISISNAGSYMDVYNLFAQTYASTIGEIVTVVSGTTQIRGLTVVEDSEVETVVRSNAGNVSIFNLWSESTNVTNGLYVDNGGELFSFSGKIANATNAMRVDSDGVLKVNGVCIEGSVDYDLLVEDASCTFIGTGCSLNRDKLSIENGADVRSFGYDAYADKTRILGDFSIGTEDVGAISQFGEGGSYEHAVKVKTYDGSDYHTLTTQSGISFPNTTSGTCIYIGSDYKFYGLKYTLTSGIDMGSGGVACEYYDSNGSWVAFNKMNTLENYSDIVDIFTGVGETYTLRFDQNIDTGVYESDVTASGVALTSVDGVNGYWIRHRIVDNITSSQEVTSLRLKGNYFVARSNGTRSFHGSARVEEIKELIIGATSAGTADEALSVSSSITFPYTQNEMATIGADEAVYSRFIIPSDCDLSCGLSYTYEITNIDSPPADRVVHLTVTMAGINGDDKFDGAVPEYVVDDFTFTILGTDTAWTIWRKVSVSRFDLSGFDPGNVIYCKLHRPNDGSDTYTNSVCLSNHYMEYRSWQDGISNRV